MEYITIFLLAISLSLDAFSLSVCYGFLNIKKEKIILISLLVGFFHFLMPLLGIEVGEYILNYINFDTSYIMIFILIMIAIEMLKSFKECEIKEKNVNLAKSLSFAFLVSIDSFLVGIGLSVITNKIILSSTIFSLFSSVLTLSGFLLGKYITKKFQKKAKLLGILIIFTLIIVFLCK